MLENEKQDNRRSNMVYWLESRGLKDAYAAQSRYEKQEFLMQHYADKMLAKNRDKASNLNEFSEKTFANKLGWEWMGKQEMINAFGAEKALGKINSGNLETRPDRDSGLDTEWSREYCVWRDKGAQHEQSGRRTDLNSHKKLSESEAKEERDALLAQMSCMGGKDNNQEAGEHTKEAESQRTQTKHQAHHVAELPSAATAALMQKDIKKEMKAIADMLMEAKESLSLNKYASRVYIIIV